MQRLLFIYIIIVAPAFSTAQNIHVVDASTRNPIANVLIFCEGWSVTTDSYGQADIGGSLSCEILIFQHPSYQQLVMNKADLEAETTVLLAEKIIHIEEVVVSANRWEQDIDMVPQEILSIRKKTIHEQQPQTSADMLSATGKVFVQKSQLGGGSPMLRGFAANNVLIVVDGVRMNNAIYRSGNLQNVINIDPLALEGSEVIFGPGSVIYGSDALGGVMDFHTIKPTFSKDEVRFDGSVLGRYSTATKEKTGHLDFAISGNNLSLFSSLTFTDLDDLRSGKNFMNRFPDFGKKNFLVQRSGNTDILVENPDPHIQDPSGYNLYSSVNKLLFRIKSVDLTYSLYYSSTSDIPRYDRLIETDSEGMPAYAEWYYGSQKWMMNSFKVEYYEDKILFDQLRFILANQQTRESRHDRRFNSNSLRNQNEELSIWSANLDFDKQFTGSSLYYGFETLTNKVSSTADRVDIISGSKSTAEPRYPSKGSYWNSYASYLSYTKGFKKINLSGGLRYSYITMNAKSQSSNITTRNNIEIANSAMTGSVGAVYSFDERWSIKSNISSGFRSPNIDDVGKIFEVSENTLSVPNEGLKPQFTYSTEVSALYKTEKWLLEFTTYQTWVEQVMTRNPFNLNGEPFFTTEEGDLLQVVALTNSGEAQIRGFDLSLSHEFTDHLGFTGNFSYTFGEESDGTPLRHIPPAFGQLRIIYKKGAFKSSIYFNYNLAKEAEDIPQEELISKPHLYTTEGSIPAWHNVNLNFSHHFRKTFTVRFIAENLFDLHYRTYSSGISAPGRNFSFTLSKTF